jgi:hypothetical protein
VISLKSTSFWQVVLAIIATTAIAALVTVALTNDSSAFQRDLISAIEQQKSCVVTRDGTDGTDGKDGNDGADGQDGKDGADGQDGTAGADGTCQIVIGPEGQVGAAGPIGPAGPTGPKGDTGGITGYHGSFYDTTTQPIIAVNTPQAMRLNNGTSGANWVSADQVSIVDDSRITFANPGVYNISFSAQMAKTANQLDPVDIWLRYKGTDLPWTNTEFPVDSDTKRYVAAWNFLIKVTNAYDWVELMWSTPEPTMRILSVPPQSNPTRPGIPSLLLSVQQVQ